MAKIPLRSYNREIEAMIDRGQPSQAVNHCLHILKFFPKHIDTYRLLGKAYLELQNYSEATDVLQRVLACVPDDFISQIGMGIIREEEGHLDAAIWHMERAFEVQPSNVGVQDELRRLFEKRDGVQPAKIRLTRGALVRMYARGELYQQAIAEIRVALMEDPQRIDLETLLARMYFLSGQKVAATEVCTRLIGKLPFCFEANRILAEVLPESARADDAKNYLQRVHAMDPYLAHLTPQTLTSAEVPDSALELDRLEWLPETKAGQPSEWSKIIGADWSAQDESIPDWITGRVVEETPPDAAPLSIEPPAAEEKPGLEEISAEEPFTPAILPEAPFISEEPAEPTERTEGADQFPDWMQGVDLQPAGEEAAEDPYAKLSAEESPEAEAFEPAEKTEDTEQIPEWLQQTDLQPVGQETGEEPSGIFSSEELPEEAVFEPAEQADMPEQISEWMQQTDMQPASEGIAEEPPAGIFSSEELPAEEVFESAEIAETTDQPPDWEQPADLEPASSEAAEGVPGRLESEELPEDEQTEPAVDADITEKIPDWMQQAGWHPASGEAVEEPLGELETSDEISEAAEPEEEIAQAEIPEWLAALAPSEEPEPEEETASTGWLESILPPEPTALSEESGAEEPSEETTISVPSASGESTEQPAVAETQIGEGYEAEELISEFTTQEETAPEGETPPSVSPFPEEPTAEEFQTPDWLADLQAPEVEGEGETPSWLEELSLETPETTPVDGEEPASEWLQIEPFEVAAPIEELAMEDQELTPESEAGPNLDDTQPVKLKREGQPAPEAEPAPAGETAGEEDFDQTMSWLEELAAKETGDEEAAPLLAEEPGALAPDWIPEASGEEAEQLLPAQLEAEEEKAPIEEGFTFPAEETLEEAAGIGAIFDEEFHGEGPALTGLEIEAEAEEGVSAPEVPVEETFKAEEELVTEPEEEVVGGADEFLDAFKALTPEAEEEIEQPEGELAESLESVFQTVAEDEESGEKPVEDELPDWLRQMMASEVEETEAAAESQIPGLERAEAEVGLKALQPEEIEAEVEGETPQLEETEAEVEGETPQLEDIEAAIQSEAPELEGYEAAIEAETPELAEIEAAAEAPLPDEPISEESLDWLHELTAEEELPAEEKPVEEIPLESAGEPEIPGAFIEGESILKADETAEEEGLPEWLRGVDEEAAAEEPLREFSFEQVTPELETEEAEAEWTPEMPTGEPSVEAEALIEDTSPLKLAAEAEAASGSAQLLKQAQAALEAHNIERALESYETLIKSGEHLEDTIHDLRDALYRYPIDVSMWQLLGDAYMKSNRLQDALDAYNKAEELLR